MPTTVKNENDVAKAITLRLGGKAVRDLEWIAKHYGGISMTEVFRRAVATEKLLLDYQDRGHEIILEDKETKRQKVLTLR